MSPTDIAAIPTLVIGSKNYSSWSLRPWLFLRKMGFNFVERVIAFDAPDYQAQIAAVSPSRRVPLLLVGANAIWDSLAICEYVAEVTGRGWPGNSMARARARSVAAEMHSGFQTLRESCPMNVRARERSVPQTVPLKKDIARIDEIWTGCLEQFAGHGGWLFGEFSIADAMYAPVWFRFQTFGATLGARSRAYLNYALSDAAVRAWQEDSRRETHTLPEVDATGQS
jgi:glutathione S-transferase